MLSSNPLMVSGNILSSTRLLVSSTEALYSQCSSGTGFSQMSCHKFYHSSSRVPCLFIPVFNTASWISDFAGRHGCIADENYFVVCRIFMNDVFRVYSLILSSSIIFPDCFVRSYESKNTQIFKLCLSCRKHSSQILI